MKKLYSIKNITALESHVETGLLGRIANAEKIFYELYKEHPILCVRSPGRAEIIGNHTDYNNGYALAAAISRSIVALYSPRTDGMVTIASDAFKANKNTFSLKELVKEPKNHWVNYVRGVLHELQQAGIALQGANVYLSSNLPSSGGVSSSAALELAIAEGFLALANTNKSALEKAMLCKRAENGEFVGTPCGLLDQASIALGKEHSLVFIDFLATAISPATTKIISADKTLLGYSFVIAVDKQVKRNLGETGYPARRKMCEESLPIISKLLGREISSLREVSVPEFLSFKTKLSEEGRQVLTMRVEHIVLENQRVLDSVKAIDTGNATWFGELLTQSGESALTLYGLDEKTPELTRLVAMQRDRKDVVGIRNMGGGFSAITLALLKTSDLEEFTKSVKEQYQEEFGKALEFIDFVATDGAGVLA